MVVNKGVISEVTVPNLSMLELAEIVNLGCKHRVYTLTKLNQ